MEFVIGMCSGGGHGRGHRNDIFFALAGIIFGDEIGKKIAVKMLIGSLILAILLSPEFGIALALSPIVLGIMILVGLIAFIKNL